ncbi:hypothetical protein C1I98_37155 [Spongiactinospora gelatinilytica]|uniref:Uncharacterized protein n=1 Tax=Spongiactinospora gelatinilytica TaxID=2666298 RepID=A0A2W2EFI4_9ACTN|nr:hypothetical protein [Spongiactinospora gelatinilytica]PZG21301.1 hypothetical protein C1I98_37155 [Spongiactinospora gelatinilytica]
MTRQVLADWVTILLGIVIVFLAVITALGFRRKEGGTGWRFTWWAWVTAVGNVAFGVLLVAVRFWGGG